MTPEEKRPFVQRLFSRIAPRYDWFNRLASFGLDQRWRRAAVVRGGIAPGQRILDVCTGTGDLAVLCARRYGAAVGIDMNREMLGRARRKSRAKRLPIGWVQGDAEALPFPSETFDRVVIGFSTRNLSNLTQGLTDMVRVLRPGGQLLILETGYPSNPLLRVGYQLFLFTVARLIGFLLTGRLWPFTYLARSVKQFLTPPQMIDRLQRLDTQVEYVPLSHGLASLYVAAKIGPKPDADCAADGQHSILEVTSCRP
ncbi:MAG: ubiquinone/menaquinone biosynthesis methyltransferase [Candidatus Omnitrophica bacterium]|nr:ubiquinone/menaquinone biosynthesis methyltransferase [Candidatus Omnitrophota bacterium]